LSILEIYIFGIDQMENFSSTKYIILLLLLCLCIFFPHLDLFFVNIMEARNFTTAREMVELGNWLIPTMNGELRLEKPPLPTWITAFVIKLFGTESIALLRIPAAIASTLLVFYGYRFVDLITKNGLQAFISAAVMSTSLYIIYVGRTGTWDIFCHSFMMMAIYYLMKGFKMQKQNYLLFFYAGICLGLSFMSKGPISFYALLLPFLLAHMIFYNSYVYKFHSKAFVLMIIIALIASLWWPILVYYLEQSGADRIMDKETTAWFNRSTKPFLHYWSFPIQSGLWTTFFINALFFYFIRDRIRYRKEYRLIFWWVLGSVFFLSLVPEKKERYLLPVLIPGAFLIGFYFQLLYKYFHKNFTASKIVSLPAFFHFGLIAAVSIAIPIVFYLFVFINYDIPLWQFLGIAILFPLIGIYIGYHIYKRDISNAFYGMLILMVSTTIFLLPFVNYFFDANPKFNDYKELQKMEVVEGMDFYSVDFFRIEIAWETGRRVGEWNLAKEAWPSRKSTIGLFSIKPLAEVYELQFLNHYKIELIDVYDNNRFLPDSRKYKQEFRKHFYLVSRKFE